ncbi:MAG: YihY/virulence factor BrkB family protein [Bacilli bacterium]|nr:YihY/virulence factor BrkB family protein [Bacilli bacterium]
MIKEYLKKNLNINVVKINEMEILPGHLSFYLIFMIIPIISFIGLIGSQINLNLGTILINKNIPKAVASLIQEININSSNMNILIFTILSLWLASRGTKAIIISSNLLFKIKEDDNLKIRIKSLVVTVILFILIGFMIIVPVLGDLIINYLSSIMTNSSIINFMNSFYDLLKYPISVVLIFFLVKVLYTISPTVKIESKYMNKGSFFTTVMWLLSSRIYSFYLNNFNHYNLYYGNMSNILILLVWVYLISYIFVIGMSINANSYLNRK